MGANAWYKDWFNSPYYHLLYNNRDEDEAQAFLERLIAYLQPKKGAKMLDVACGKGRHSKALADMGFDVTGIDLSASSIAAAKLDETEHLHFYEHDMRLPFWINYFDFAFNFFTSFGYFKTEREHNNALRTIAQSLRAEGLFVIDYLNVHYTEDHLQKSFTKIIDGITFHVSKWHDEHQFFKQIQVTDATNLSPKHISTEKVAKFSLGDFTDMLAYQQMQIQHVFGDYQLGSYDVKKSPRMIIVAKKIG
ncbi:class I SAM-dependent methyltransferase [Parasediminibacterium paludis]|uniref:Class I SAM-dependent methyltransferase n=1 Tax=Parasediminibacterium paludis TaxID=908966 RepID=A0ABV8PRB5_9BACT